MKQLFLVFISLIFFTSCEHSILDKQFYADYYEADYTQFITDPEVSNDEAFLINYTIMRQREYFGYDLVEKTYSEILELGKQFEKNGMKVNQTYDDKEVIKNFSTKITNQEISYMEKKNSSTRKSKHLKFSCLLENTSSENQAVNTITFIIKGPFGQHLVTSAYEINCKLLPGEKQTLHFIVNAKKMRSSLFFEKPHKVKRTLIDDLIRKSKIEVGGIRTDKDSKFYSECLMSGYVLEPFMVSNYKEMYPEGIKVETVKGIPTIHRGSASFQQSEEEIIKYK